MAGFFNNKTNNTMQQNTTTTPANTTTAQNNNQFSNGQLISSNIDSSKEDVNKRFTQNLNKAANPNASTSNKEDLEVKTEYDSKGRAKKPTKTYSYTILNDMNKKEKSSLVAETEEEVRNFLVSQHYRIVNVELRKATDIEITFGKISAQDLAFSLTQLSTYIKSGIPLADSVTILAKQATKPHLRTSFNQLVFELLKGENLSDAMTSQSKLYPSLLINMVKTAEMTGDLPSILDDMADYYTAIDQTKKQMKSAMTYPIVVLIIAFGVLIFMLTYLVPQFSSMFQDNGAELPVLTQTILSVSKFITGNWIILLLAVITLVVIFIVLMKKVISFKRGVQITLMHIPVIKDIIIYNEVANFTKTFASLINHGVFITDSMEILSKITNNEIYKGIINNCLTNLAKGESVSTAFKGQWAFPVVAYEMIVTGERTGQLGPMMEKVADHFQMLHKNIIDQMKSMVEPMLIVVLAVIVGIILLSIIQPMFAIYDTVK
ncbi:MAG: type II secretion system F family protein [Bacilli bacterium]|nr:type II secretion system F family protein [Bacilli bacterium]